MRYMMIVLMMALIAACSGDPEPQIEDAGGADDAANGADDAGHDMADALAVSDAATDVGADVASDMAGDAAPGDASADVSVDASPDAAPDMAMVTCIDGLSGGSNDFCENTVTCDGTEYYVTCTYATSSCTCEVDGVSAGEVQADSCGYDTLRDCGAPIPPENPICTADDIYSGGGVDENGGYCEVGVTCNDVNYEVTCYSDTGKCTCTVDGNEVSVTATNCSDPEGVLTECGAPLQ